MTPDRLSPVLRSGGRLGLHCGASCGVAAGAGLSSWAAVAGVSARRSPRGCSGRSPPRATRAAHPCAAAAVVAGGRVGRVGASGLAVVRAASSPVLPWHAVRHRERHEAVRRWLGGATRRHRRPRPGRPAEPLGAAVSWGARRITLRELLDQTSGLDDYVTDGRFLAAERRRGPAVRVGAATAPALRPVAGGAPGERWNYSNANYLLLGLVVERAIHRRIGPQLPDVFVFQPQERPAGDVAVGYFDGRPSRNDPFLPSRAIASSAWASGNLLASAGDLARLGGRSAARGAPPRDDALGEGVLRRRARVWARAYAHSARRPGRRGHSGDMTASTPTSGICRRPT